MAEADTRVDDSGKAPCVLIVATGRWVSTARLSMALAGLGCRVELVAMRDHPAHKTGVFRATYRYDPLRPLQSVGRALRKAKPDAVIPADELALIHLDELARAEEAAQIVGAGGEAEGSLRQLLGRSIGGAQVFAAAESRMELLRIAQDVGVGVPETVEVTSDQNLRAALEQMGLPLVLKADSTSGGRGVRLAESADEAMTAWKMLQRPPGLVRVLKRGVVEKDWTHLRSWARKTTRGVTAQRFIPFVPSVPGGERTGMAMCRRGEVVAFVCLEVLETWCERGPSSIVRVIDDAVMERAMRLVAGRLGVSGFCGFDFIVDPVSGTPLLIEMNPRPTQLVHLPLGPGRDLAAAYAREILGMSAVRDRESATERALIAVFPLELQRDPTGRSLGAAFHDVPWESPALVRRVLGRVPRRLTVDVRWRGDLR